MVAADSRHDALGQELTDLTDTVRQQIMVENPCSPGNHTAIARGFVILSRTVQDNREYLRDTLPETIRTIVREEVQRASTGGGKVGPWSLAGIGGAGAMTPICWLAWNIGKAKGWIP